MRGIPCCSGPAHCHSTVGRSYGFLSPEIRLGGQTLWAASPPCFVPQRISRPLERPRGQRQKPGRGQHPASKGPHHQTLPSWGSTGHCTKSYCWDPGTQARAESKAQGPSDLGGASQKQLPRELGSAAFHVRPSEEYSVCTHQSETAALCQAYVGLGPQRNQPHLFPHPHPALGSKGKGVGMEPVF